MLCDRPRRASPFSLSTAESYSLLGIADAGYPEGMLRGQTGLTVLKVACGESLESMAGISSNVLLELRRCIPAEPRRERNTSRDRYRTIRSKTSCIPHCRNITLIRLTNPKFRSKRRRSQGLQGESIEGLKRDYSDHRISSDPKARITQQFLVERLFLNHIRFTLETRCPAAALPERAPLRARGDSGPPPSRLRSSCPGRTSSSAG